MVNFPEMQRTLLNTIRLDTPDNPDIKLWVEHFMIIENADTSYFEAVDSQKILMQVDHHASATVDGKCIGHFFMSDGALWDFVFADENGRCDYHSENRIKTPNKDLIKSEVRVFKELVARGLIKLN